MRHLFFILIVLVPLASSAQQDSTKQEEMLFGQQAEVLPEYPGGPEAVLRHIAENVNYPKEARDKGITGVVYVQYDVLTDGSLGNFVVVRGAHPLLDAEAVRAVQTLGNYKPGMQRGKPVVVAMTLPIRFNLANTGKPKKKKKKRRKKNN